MNMLERMGVENNEDSPLRMTKKSPSPVKSFMYFSSESDNLRITGHSSAKSKESH